MKQPTLFCLYLFVIFSLSSCVSAKKGKEFRGDISALNIRLMQLEQHTDASIGKTQTSSQAASKRLATSATRIDQITTDLQAIKGELDALRVGVAMGRMPGAPAEQESIASTLDTLIGRLDKVEEAQVEILSQLEKNRQAGSKKTKKGSDRKKNRIKAIKSLKALRAAFNKKRYQDVLQASKTVKRNLKKKSRGEVEFYESESLYLLGRLREAALKYNKLIEKYPKETYTPQARLRMGDCFRHLGDKDMARIYYQELIELSPSVTQAATAKDRLAKMK